MKAANGKTVKVSYTGKLNDGTVFDSSAEKKPLEFVLGEKQMIQGFEEGVIGMSSGERKTIHVPAGKAYGPHLKERVIIVDRSFFPPDVEPEAGRYVDIHQENGTTVPAMIIRASKSSVAMDINHPLAGKELTFEIELLEVK